jgi:hypothetical protein
MKQKNQTGVLKYNTQSFTGGGMKINPMIIIIGLTLVYLIVV